MQHRFYWLASVLAALVLGLVASIGSGGPIAHAQRMFSAASIHGSYGISYSVALLNPSGPAQFLSGTGVYQADGAGHLTGEEPNGTGTVLVTFTSATAGCSVVSFQQNLVIMAQGESSAWPTRFRLK
jgi:hypothetical protein